MVSYTKILDIIRDKNVELRHDVDISLVSAYKMAQLEYQEGVRSIYYIRFQSDYYNPLSPSSVSMLERMVNMGHELGLHVEGTEVYDDQSLIDNLNSLGTVFEFSKFTFHINTYSTAKFIEDKYAGYDNKSIIKGGYISDSRGEFGRDKLNWIKKNDNYTLLIHPEWWIHKGTKKEIIEKAIKEILP